MAAMMEMVKLDIAGLKAAAKAPAPAKGGKAKRRH
jgi:hypothetical protein